MYIYIESINACDVYLCWIRMVMIQYPTENAGAVGGCSVTMGMGEKEKRYTIGFVVVVTLS